MAEKGNGGGAEVVPHGKPRCRQIADGGIASVEDFSRLMSALMTDVIQGTVSPPVANATVNAGGKLLKAVEMQMKYGKQEGGEGKQLLLAPPVPTEPPASQQAELLALREKIDAAIQANAAPQQPPAKPARKRKAA